MPTSKQTHVGFISTTWSNVSDQTNLNVPPAIFNDVYRYPISRTDLRTGDVNPQWKSQIRLGGNATTIMHAERYARYGDHSFQTNLNYDYIDSNGKVFGHYIDYRFGSLPWQYPGNVTPPSDVLAEVRNRCIRKFLEAAKSARSSVEAGQDFGEIKQTIESMIHPMNSLKQLTLGYFSKLTKAKKRYNRDNHSLRKALSDSYLEYRFGWRPLALDIADAYSGLTMRDRMTDVQAIQASASQTFSGSNDYTGDLPNLSGHVLARKKTFSSYTMRLKGAIKTDALNGRIPVLQALQLSTLNDFAVTAWDLLPYSFVVDYFLNVGDCINAVTFPTSKLTWLCQTTRNVARNEYSLVPSNVYYGPPGVNVHRKSQSGGNSILESVFVDRLPISTDSLVPTVRFSLPVSSRPWENIAALLSSNIKSLVPFHK